jgi:hypothetical protein
MSIFIIFRDHHDPESIADEFVAAVNDFKEAEEVVKLLNEEQIAMWGDDWDTKGVSYWVMEYPLSTAAQALVFCSGYKKNY